MLKIWGDLSLVRAGETSCSILASPAIDQGKPHLGNIWDKRLAHPGQGEGNQAGGVREIIDGFRLKAGRRGKTREGNQIIAEMAPESTRKAGEGDNWSEGWDCSGRFIRGRSSRPELEAPRWRSAGALMGVWTFAHSDYP